MTLILVTSLSLAAVIHRERIRRFKRKLIDQAIAVEGAYASYQNAELAHQNARADAVLYLEKAGKGLAIANNELSSDEDPIDQKFKILKYANKNALEKSDFMRHIWEEEKMKLFELIKELNEAW
jgi:hypothetical protein